MGYTVAKRGGTKNGEFEAYARLLRQQGKDLGKLPRVPEPNANARRSWLHVWNDSEDAQAFAKELRKRTGDDAWEVVPVTVQPSEGPLGPILIQQARRGDGISFSLHILSHWLIRSAFPHAVGVSRVGFEPETWRDFYRVHGGLRTVVRQVAPSLTGLTLEQLETLGYAVIDDEDFETILYQPPAELAAVATASS